MKSCPSGWPGWPRLTPKPSCFPAALSRETPPPYSDLDLAHIVDDSYTGPEKKFYYRGNLLVSVNSRTLEWWRRAITLPERAIFVVPAMRSARILLDPDGMFARYQSELADFSWAPLQPAADLFAAAATAAQAETVHKILGALWRGEGLYEPTVMLALDMTQVMAVQSGVMIDGSASYLRQVRAAVGDDSAWSRYHRITTGQCGPGETPPTQRQQAQAAIRLYRETFRLIEPVMPPDRRDLALATVAVVDDAEGTVL